MTESRFRPREVGTEGPWNVKGTHTQSALGAWPGDLTSTSWRPRDDTSVVIVTLRTGDWHVEQ